LRAGLSQAQLAARMGTSQSIIARLDENMGRRGFELPKHPAMT
jgi:transcriptional regulator with XRE-family HTH domain